MVLVEVLGYGVGVHLNVGKFVAVPLEVDLEVALGGEATAADVALERALTCVRSYVDLQSRVAPEDLAAVAAAVLEEGLAATTGALAVVRRQPLALATSTAERELVREVVSKKALTGVVEHLLGTLLQHLKGVGLVQRQRVVVCDDGGGERRANGAESRHLVWHLTTGHASDGRGYRSPRRQGTTAKGHIEG